MGEYIVPILVAAVTGVLAQIVGGLLTRPKTKAEADAAKATADVALSAEARQWAGVFETRATAAEAKAQSAEEHVDRLEKRVDKLTAYTRMLRGELERLNALVPADQRRTIPLPPDWE